MVVPGHESLPVVATKIRVKGTSIIDLSQISNYFATAYIGETDDQRGQAF
jgi:hypothetical protein